MNREIILKNCNEAKEDRIIITHGTGTIEETAKYIQKSITKKTIVLTGAIVPYSFGNSDGLFNLGCTIAFVQTLPAGGICSYEWLFFLLLHHINPFQHLL